MVEKQIGVLIPLIRDHKGGGIIAKAREDLDWNAIRVEYVTTKVSYSDLSKKYRVSKTRIATVASEQGWVKQREQLLNDAFTKTIKDIEKQQARRMLNLFNITDKVLETLSEAIENADGDSAKALVLSDPKKLTGAIKDIKEIYMLRSAADLDEQQARIEKLKKDAEDRNQTTGVEVVFESEEAEWAK